MKIIIETCFSLKTNCSLTNPDCYLKAFKNILNLSMIKLPPNKHNLNIKDFDNDVHSLEKRSVDLQYHVKFALLYLNENNYSLLINNLYNSSKLTESEIQPTIYILYDPIKESKGDPNRIEENCDICKQKVTTEFAFSNYVNVFKKEDYN